MRLKSGVDLTGVSWRLFLAAVLIEPIFIRRGVELVITSGVDGEHSEGSLHEKGLALDFRSHDLPAPASVLTEIRNTLEPLGYAVLLESNHFHVQYTDENIRNYATLSGAKLT